jgi:hypothetical protein
MRLGSALLVACALYAQAQMAHADILRCGSVLIQQGDAAVRVLEKCGQPTSKMTVNEPVWARGANGAMYQAGNAQAEIWRYNLGPTKFPAILRIVDGAVESITFEKSHG